MIYKVGTDVVGIASLLSSAKLKEAALPMTTSHDALRGHLRTALRTAHGVTGDMWSPDGPWVNDVFPTHVVYQHKGQTLKRSYTSTQNAAGKDPSITLGDPKAVHTAYVDSKEAAITLAITPNDDLIEDKEALSKESGVTVTPEEGVVESTESVICLTEAEFTTLKAATKPQVLPIKIISAGWGSKAYYPKAVLKRDGPVAFPKGTHMMWNHPTMTEEIDRPERDLSELAAVLVESAQWDDNGAKGPGLYAKAKVFSDYATQVSEKGSHIGVSINAFIKKHEGEMEGKRGFIADQFTRTVSVDFVTKAGAGGAPIVPAQESDRRNLPKESTMTEAEILALQNSLKETNTRLQALETENKTLKEGNSQFLAFTAIGTALKEAEIEYNPKLLQRACASPVMKEGKLDPDWIKGVVADFSDGVNGKVKGMGKSKEAIKEEEDGVKLTESEQKSFKETLKELGVPDAGLDMAVKGGR